MTGIQFIYQILPLVISYQQYDYQTNGNNGKLSANIAFQYNDNISFGLNLNSHFIEFEKSTYLLEENNNDGSSINLVNFQNQLYTNGEGFSMQFGGLFKLSRNFRFGFSYTSPTWLTLREETTQYLATASIIDDTNYIVNPSIVNIFPIIAKNSRQYHGEFRIYTW